MPEQKHINEFLISDDKSRLDVDLIHTYLSKESYWAQNIPFERVKKSIDGSVCFGVYHNSKQIGFARVITDHSSFGYLADVFILEPYRGKGLSKELMKFIMDYPGFKDYRRFMLATRDAHELYKQFGFTPLSTPERFMEIKPFEKYPG
ncbi:MAG: family acetyltransferase [Bacteroidetes bacterium]|jgi:GNAT superfamily N-acetyltransferase|nr:family acetyltransferase [Bacteroidota bacterium]